MDTVRCPKCGKEHDLSDSEVGFELPDVVFTLSEDERRRRATFNADLCELDETRAFLRGVLDLPVHGRSLPFGWGVWAEVEKAAFERCLELWQDPEQANEPPFRGTLANALPGYPNTLGLPLHIQLTTPTQRPSFHLVAGPHPLAREQQIGLDLPRVIEIVARVAHRDWHDAV